MKALLAIVAASIVFSLFPQRRDAPVDLLVDGQIFPSSNTIMAGEEYLYEVRWAFFKLGTIRIKSYGNFEARAWIDSYDIPFVNLHSVYYTRMDSAFFSLGGYSIDKTADGWEGLNYVSEWGGRLLLVETIKQKGPTGEPYEREVADTLTLTSGRFVDGLAIGFLPRLLVHSNQTVEVPTVLNGKAGSTTFTFEGRKGHESIEVLDDLVKTVELKGTTNAEGIYGMTGDFTGWFSVDEVAVPIKGKLNVLIGNVTVELVEWRRENWAPPQ